MKKFNLILLGLSTAILITLMILLPKPSNLVKVEGSFLTNIKRATVQIWDGNDWQASGVVISERGLIVTARHCLDSNDIYVKFYDGRKCKAKQVWRSKDYDVGFVFINKFCKSVVPIGDFHSLSCGDELWLVGTPLVPMLGWSLHKGILANHNRSVPYMDGWINLFQVDISIYPGCSGCGIYSQGHLVGIFVGFPVFGCTPAQRIAYCIPVDIVVKERNLIKGMR